MQYVNLIQNPINTKELNNAETLQTLRDRNVTINIVETNITTNLNFKDEEFKKALIDDGKDLDKDNEISGLCKISNIIKCRVMSPSVKLLAFHAL